MPVAKPVSSDGRVIAHIDMDCFYVQVEQRKQPELRGLPTAVVQYNSWQGGGLIAVSYEARKFGVKRSMRGDEAKKVCPGIQLVQVPVARGKADLNIYRAAGSEVVAILSRRGRCERASIDEVYLDLTDAAETMLAERPPECIESIDDEALKSHVLGLSQDGDVKDNVKHWFCRSDPDHYDKLLACGALIVAELRAQVLRETEFTCSAGIAHNKMLAKLASGMNKPAQQTIVPSASVKELLGSLPIKKMKQLGGKLGDSLQSDLGVNTVGDLLQFSEGKLQEHYGINSGTWLWNIARGISGEEVEGRTLPKSHGSGKTFPGPRALRTLDSVEHWLRELCEELNERLLADLDQNKRVAHTLTVHARAYKLNDTDSQKKFPSKSCPLRYGVAKIQEDAHNLFQAGLREFMGVYGDTIDKNKKSGWGVTGLSVSASKILAMPRGTCSITKFFRSQNSDGPTLLDTPSDKINSVGLPKAGIDVGGESKQSIESKENLPTLQSMLQENFTRDSSELERKRKSQNTQGTRSVIELLQSQAQLRSSLNQSPLGEASCSMRHEMLNPETVGWSANSRTTVTNIQHKDEPTCSLGNPTMKQEQKRNKSKGTSSILKFMKSTDHPSSEVANSDSASCSAGAISEHSQGEGRQGSERWSLDPSEIDPAVFDELPPDIQEEVRAWFRPTKQSLTATGRSRITGFFSPIKESN